MTLARRAFSILRKHAAPGLIASLGSLVLTARGRDWCVVRHSDGDWIHRYRTGTVVSPALCGLTAGMQDRDTYDIFLYGYRPTYGDTVVDLGAGIGSEVRVLSRLVGPSGRVISIEAHPRIFHCLCRTIKMNSLDNVTPLQYAVTGQSGFVLITDDMESHIGNGITTDRDNALEVPAKTLAEILYDLSVDKVDLLKMNIEGAELEVLESAFDTLPVVRNLAVSCHDFIADDGGPDRLRTFTPVRKLLTEAGYGIRTRPDDRRPWVPYYLYASR